MKQTRPQLRFAMTFGLLTKPRLVVYEAYLLSNLDGSRILYAGQGTNGRAFNWLLPCRWKPQFATEPKIMFRVLVETEGESLRIEEALIDKFHPEFNKALKGNQGWHHTEEAKLSIRNASIGKPRPQNVIDKIQQARKPQLREIAKKISAALMGHPVSEETKRKSAETKARRKQNA